LIFIFQSFENPEGKIWRRPAAQKGYNILEDHCAKKLTWWSQNNPNLKHGSRVVGLWYFLPDEHFLPPSPAKEAAGRQQPPLARVEVN